MTCGSAGEGPLGWVVASARRRFGQLQVPGEAADVRDGLRWAARSRAGSAAPNARTRFLPAATATPPSGVSTTSG